MSIPASTICPAVTQVLETMYFLEAAYKGAGNPPGPVVGATLHFGGAFEGDFRVVVNREVAVRMTADFLVTDPSEITAEQAQATVNELTNVTCGAALNNWMPDADFRIHIPEVLSPDTSSGVFTHCFALEAGSIDIGFDLLIDRGALAL